MWILSILLNCCISRTFDQLGCAYDFYRPSQRSVFEFLCTLSHDIPFQSVHLWLESLCIQVHTSLKIITLIHTKRLPHTYFTPICTFSCVQVRTTLVPLLLAYVGQRFYQGFLAKQLTLKEGIKKGLKKEKGLLGQAEQKDRDGLGIREEKKQWASVRIGKPLRTL